jgi:hypothetical protein
VARGQGGDLEQHHKVGNLFAGSGRGGAHQKGPPLIGQLSGGELMGVMESSSKAVGRVDRAGQGS